MLMKERSGKLRMEMLILLQLLGFIQSYGLQTVPSGRMEASEFNMIHFEVHLII